jgi:hypothetical protein
MCTVSWSVGRSGYDLFFNRDELHTRAPEIPPEISRRNEVSYMSPQDGSQGGTWLLANESGLTVCLLNDYGASWRPPSSLPRLSRGRLVSACASAQSHSEVVDTIRGQPLGQIPAFQLLALSAEEGPLVLHWQGQQLIRKKTSESIPPLTSSSFATDEVIAQRKSRFSSYVSSYPSIVPNELAAYHRQHDPSAGAHSVLMRRGDAATRSLIHVTVNNEEVRIAYEAIAWGLAGPLMQTPTRLHLARRRRTMIA